MQDVVSGKYEVRRPNLNEPIRFAPDAEGRVAFHPNGVPVDVCRLLLIRGDHLHFDRMPVHLAERLRSCGLMTIEYLGDDHARDVRDEYSTSFSLQQFAEYPESVMAVVTHLASSILSQYPSEDQLYAAAEEGL